MPNPAFLLSFITLTLKGFSCFSEYGVDYIPEAEDTCCMVLFCTRTQFFLCFLPSLVKQGCFSALLQQFGRGDGSVLGFGAAQQANLSKPLMQAIV